MRYARWWMGMTQFAFTLGLILMLALPASAQGFRFLNFDVTGNQRIDDASVLIFAGLEPGGSVTAAEVNDARQRIQNSGLFESVEVEPNGSTLIIRVQEYPIINVISIEGNRRIDDDALTPLLTSQPRRVFSPSVAEADASVIIDAYRQQGRLAASVEPMIIRRSDNRVDLVFEVIEGRVVETQRIAFNGNRAYGDRRLRRVLESTQAGALRAFVNRDTFVEDRIAFDSQLLTDFYQDRGYIDFQVLNVTSELARERNGFFVTFNIREGQSYSFGDLSVSSDLAEVDVDSFRDVIRVSEGTTYSPRLVDLTISRMETLATQQGLRFIRVEPRVTRNDADLTLDVEFAVVRGDRVFVERIDIEGNATTLDRVIRRQFDTVEGDPFDPRQIRAAAERIRALGYFNDVQVQGREGTSPDQVIVDVDVDEGTTGALGFSLGYSSDAGVGVSVDFSERNFLGRGQGVALSFNTARASRSAQFSFTEPAFLRRDLSMELGLFYSETDNENSNFDTGSIGGRVGFGFPTGENSRASVYFTASEDSISDVSSNSSEIIQREAGDEVTAALGYEISYDTRNSGLDPNSGVFLRFGQELAGLGGDTQYIRSTALLQGVTSVAREEITLRATLEGGALNYLNDGGSRITDRFVMSSRQMRGFQPFGLGPRDLAAGNRDALGGNYFAVARFEAAFPIGLPDEYGVTGGLFLDVGSVWGLDDTVGTGGAEVDDDRYLRSTVGVSVFWDTALGPLRFNFSQPLTTEDYDQTRNFDLTVETKF